MALYSKNVMTFKWNIKFFTSHNLYHEIDLGVYLGRLYIRTTVASRLHKIKNVICKFNKEDKIDIKIKKFIKFQIFVQSFLIISIKSINSLLIKLDVEIST